MSLCQQSPAHGSGSGVRAVGTGPAMIGYASNTGTKRNLDALRLAGWRILLTPENPRWPAGFYCGLDNGAWGCFQRNEPFNVAAFEALIERHGTQTDFVIAPDIVAGGPASLAFSLPWLHRLRHCKRLLLAVQDGMEVRDVGLVLDKYPCGIFLGGSTEWKLRTMYGWGMIAAERRRYYHIGRVNTARRIRLAAEAGAQSFDGTSATRFSCTLPLLEAARQQPSLLTP